MTEQETFYGEALACIHSDGFEALARAAAEEVLARRLPLGSVVLDLGCGAGPLGEILAKKGFTIWGADVSEEFIERAKARVPVGTFVQGSVHDLDLPDANAICAIGEVLNYAIEGNKGPKSLEEHINKIHQALPSGGLFLFDLSEPGRAAGGVSRYTEGDGWAVGMRASEEGSNLIRKITTYLRWSDSTWHRSEETHILHLFDRDRVIEILARTGFEVSTSDAYGVVELPPHHVRYDAIKR